MELRDWRTVSAEDVAFDSDELSGQLIPAMELAVPRVSMLSAMEIRSWDNVVPSWAPCHRLVTPNELS